MVRASDSVPLFINQLLWLLCKLRVHYARHRAALRSPADRQERSKKGNVDKLDCTNICQRVCSFFLIHKISVVYASSSFFFSNNGTWIVIEFIAVQIIWEEQNSITESYSTYWCYVEIKKLYVADYLGITMWLILPHRTCKPHYCNHDFSPVANGIYLLVI